MLEMYYIKKAKKQHHQQKTAVQIQIWRTKTKRREEKERKRKKKGGGGGGGGRQEGSKIGRVTGDVARELFCTQNQVFTRNVVGSVPVVESAEDDD